MRSRRVVIVERGRGIGVGGHLGQLVGQGQLHQDDDDAGDHQDGDDEEIRYSDEDDADMDVL